VCYTRVDDIANNLAWSRLMRGWGGLGRFYNIFSCFKLDTKNYVIFFWSQMLLEVFDKVTV